MDNAAGKSSGAKTSGRRTVLLAGLAAAAVVLVCVAFSDEARIQYFLYRLNTGGPEYFLDVVDSAEGTAAQKAVTRFVATPPGRQRLASVTLKAVLDEKERSWRGTGWPTLDETEDLLALSGMVFRPSWNEWVLWFDIRAGIGMGSMSAIRPPFANGETLAGLLDVMCRELAPGDEVELSEYPRLRVRVQPLDEGLELYQREMEVEGKKSDGAIWSETLRRWPDLLKRKTVLRWVFYLDLRPSADG